MCGRSWLSEAALGLWGFVVVAADVRGAIGTEDGLSPRGAQLYAG